VPVKWRVYELGDFSKSASLFTEVDDYTNASILCTMNAFFNGVSEVWLASANVRAEDIRTVA